MILFPALTANLAFGQGRAPSRVAQKPAPAPFMIEAESHEESQRITKTVFKNGLTALVYEFHAQPLVSIQAYVRAGFLDDPDDDIGLAGLTARARESVGEGSPAGAIRRRAQALGGVFYSRTDPRYSRFEITVPASRWKQALNIQAEAMLTPFENNETLSSGIARAAESVREESTRPYEFATGELLSLAFGEPRFAPSGHLKITPEKIIEFHKNRYVLPEITLVIAGDVRAGDVLNEIVRVFGQKSEKANSRAAAHPVGTGLKPAGEFRYLAVPGEIAFPRIFLGFPVSSGNLEDYRALEVAAAILGTGETSILNTRLRDRKNLIFTARTEMKSFADTGFFSVELETELQNIDRAEIAFRAELEILKNDGPSEAELARALAQLERLWWERRETVSDRADTLAGLEFQNGWKRMDGYVAEIRKVTAADVKRVIERYLNLSNCALLEHLPRSYTERNTTAAAVRRTLESLLRPAVDEERKARIGEIEPNFKIPSSGAAPRLNEIRHSFQNASVLRGPEIYIREDHTSPLLEMGFYFTGGKTQEREANAGITGLMLELMLRNERETRQLEIYGGRLTPVVADDYFGFLLSIPARNYSGGFERIKQVIKSPGFDSVELEKLKQRAAARTAAARDEERRRMKEVLFRGHSYAVEPAAAPVSLKNISIETVRNWYDENVRNVKPFVAIAGTTEGTSLAAWFASEFSGSRMNERKSIAASPGPVGKTEVVNQNAGIIRPAILMGFHAPSAGDMDVYGTLVLKSHLENSLLETGSAGEKNQERRILDLRISCEYQPLLAGGSLIISAASNEGEEARSLESIREKIERIVTQPLLYADFHAARTLAAGSYMAGNQTRKAQIENLTKNMLAGRSLAEYQNFSWSIEQVDEKDFKELMRRVLDANKVITMIVQGGDR
jgi:predicted Zn-dependent peptidase